MTEDNPTYLIWSNEHRAWWGPGERGYSPGLRGAGHYTREAAIRICRHAIPQAMHEGVIAEVPVRMDDLAEMLVNQMMPDAIYGREP